MSKGCNNFHTNFEFEEPVHLLHLLSIHGCIDNKCICASGTIHMQYKIAVVMFGP